MTLGERNIELALSGWHSPSPATAGQKKGGGASVPSPGKDGNDGTARDGTA